MLSGTEDSGKFKNFNPRSGSPEEDQIFNSRLLGIAKAMALGIQSTINLRKEQEYYSASRDNDDGV